MTAGPAIRDADRSAPSATVADAPPENWVDRFAPPLLRPYMRLARLDRPIGTWLLLFPCWWSVALAEGVQGRSFPSLDLLVLFALGAIVMRGSGCAYNDYVDSAYDARVARTASRPIPSGQVRPMAALLFSFGLALVGFVVLVQLNTFAMLLGIASLGLVAVYPFMKRITRWPQAVLGLAFNWGALMGWAAVMGSLALPPLLLYAGSVLWTIGYDTIYAHQDADDDAMLGLKSTALMFGENSVFAVGGFYAGAVLLWLAAAALAGTHAVFYLGLGLVALHLARQALTLDIHDAANCLKRFRSNRDVGALMFASLVAAMVLA